MHARVTMSMVTLYKFGVSNATKPQITVLLILHIFWLEYFIEIHNYKRDSPSHFFWGGTRMTEHDVNLTSFLADLSNPLRTDFLDIMQ